MAEIQRVGFVLGFQTHGFESALYTSENHQNPLPYQGSGTVQHKIHVGSFLPPQTHNMGVTCPHQQLPHYIQTTHPYKHIYTTPHRVQLPPTGNNKRRSTAFLLGSDLTLFLPARRASIPIT